MLLDPLDRHSQASMVWHLKFVQPNRLSSSILATSSVDFQKSQTWLSCSYAPVSLKLLQNVELEEDWLSKRLTHVIVLHTYRLGPTYWITLWISEQLQQSWSIITDDCVGFATRSRESCDSIAIIQASVFSPFTFSTWTTLVTKLANKQHQCFNGLCITVTSNGPKKSTRSWRDIPYLLLVPVAN